MKKLTIFFLLLTTLGLQAQYTCETALTATIGINTIPATDSSEYWYSYTVTGDNNILIIDNDFYECVEVHSGCSGNTYLDYNCEQIVLNNLSAGEEVFLRWEIWAGGNFAWELSEVPISEGDICEMPATAVEGTNHVPSTALSAYWYAFTMPREGKLVVSSSAGENISIYNDYCSDWPQELSGGYQQTTYANVAAGEQIFINWSTSGGGNFEWNISIEALEDGDNPFRAIPALVGTNSVPVNSSNYCWYTISVPDTSGALNITVPSSRTLALFDRPWQTYASSQKYTSEAIFNDLSPGQTYYLKLPTGNGADFDWTLSWSALQSGNACLSAVTAQLGTNSVPTTVNIRYYFTYIMPQSGKLTVSNDNSKFVSIFKGSCNGFTNQRYGSGSVSMLNLAQGDTVIIAWETYMGGNFEWELSVDAMDAGEVCSIAATATEGINHLPETTTSYYWYTSSIPEGKKAIISNTEGYYFYTHLGTCEQYYGVDATSNTTVVANYSDGDMLLIEWEAYGGNFDWSLQFEDIENGDKCSNAVAALSGTNSLTTSNRHSYWYTYTMPSDGNLVVTSDTGKFVQILTGDCETVYTSVVSGKNRVEATTLSAGDEAYIVWNLYGQDVDFEWNITTEAQQAGDNCSLAVSASEGTNTLPVTDNDTYWYTFTMPQTGKLVIESESDKYVYLNGGICNELSFQSSAKNYLEATNFVVGDVVSISWETKRSGNFDWELSVIPLIAGDNCELAETAILGANIMQGESRGYSWYTFTMPYDGRLECFSYESIWMSTLTGTCNNSDISDYGWYYMQTKSFEAGEEVILQIQQQFSGTVAWFLSVMQTQSITFPAIANQDIYADSLVLNATASSGLPVMYSLVDGPAILDSNVVHFTGTGTVTITAMQPGNDTVEAATPVTQSFSITNINSLEEELLPEMTLYPNPARERFYLVTGEAQPEQMALYTPDGRIAQQLNPAKHEFDVSQLQPGMYILKVQINKTIFSYRLLKQ